jgi:hypothetical protein
MKNPNRRVIMVAEVVIKHTTKDFGLGVGVVSSREVALDSASPACAAAAMISLEDKFIAEDIEVRWTQKKGSG